MTMRIRRGSGFRPSPHTVGNCQAIVAMIRKRGPMWFAELLAATKHPQGRLTFYVRRLASRGEILRVGMDGAKVRWGLPQHAPPKPPNDEIRIAQRIEIGRGYNWRAGIV